MGKFNTPSARETAVINNVFHTTWMSFFSSVARKIGSDRKYSLGGALTSNTTDVGNVGSGEDNLMAYTLEKNSLIEVGDMVEVTAFGTQAANANNKTIKLYLGATELFDTGAVASSAKDWELTCKIIRTGPATQDCITTFNGDTVLVTQTTTYIAGTEDLTTALIIKCTGEATANNDIIQKGLFIKLFPTT